VDVTIAGTPTLEQPLPSTETSGCGSSAGARPGGPRERGRAVRRHTITMHGGCDIQGRIRPAANLLDGRGPWGSGQS